MRGHSTETWVYVDYVNLSLLLSLFMALGVLWLRLFRPRYFGYTRVGAAGGRAGVNVAGGSVHHHVGRTFVFFGSPFLRSILLFAAPAEYSLSR